MRLLFLLLAPILGYSQPSGTLTYHTKEVHSIGWKTDTATSYWRIDTINYSVPFDIKIESGNGWGWISGDTLTYPTNFGGMVTIDGYGSFAVDSSKRKYNSPYWNYWLKGGKQFALIENYGYLTYPTVNKKSQIIIFYID